MKTQRTSPIFTITFTLLGLIAFAVQTTKAQTLAEVIALHEKNSLTKSVDLKSMVLEGKTILTGMNMEFKTIVYRKAPNLFKVEVPIQGKALIKAYDGNVAWKADPFPGGSDKPTRMAGAEETDMLLGVDFDHEFIDAAKKGNKVTLEGVEDIDEVPCYKIKVVRKDKHVKTYFLEKETGILMMERGPSTHPLKPGTLVEKETYFSEYKEVQGVMIAHYMEERIGGQVTAKMQFDNIKINAKLDNKVFAFPSKQ
ncbi:hypothetical protein BKI52_23865 [marine bacterium AO1-C]|nr:hypothetical protein BKI52_23865 [marine bacterium AO1-C]